MTEAGMDFDPKLVEACVDEAERQNREFGIDLERGVAIAMTTLPPRGALSTISAREDLVSQIWQKIGRRYQERREEVVKPRMRRSIVFLDKVNRGRLDRVRWII